MKTKVVDSCRHPLLRLILGALGAVCLIAVLILWQCGNRITNPLEHQKGAERWQGDGALQYAQVSAFSSVADGMSADVIQNAGQIVDVKLVEAGIPDAAYLIDYGAEQNAVVVSENGKCSAAMTLTGGDFFRLHGFRFLSGTGYLPEDIMQDRIVLDELAAWQLFSSNDCVGMSVEVDGRIRYVAGVVACETDRTTKLCYGDKPRVYTSYHSWNGAPGETNTIPVTFCEAIFPNPVDDFAINILEEALGLEKERICSNTSRYTIPVLWKNLKDMRMQGILSNAVVYPYWESAARLAANERSILMIPIAALLVLPLGWAVYGMILLWRLLKAGGRGVAKLAENAIERRKTVKFEKTMALRRQSRERMKNNENKKVETDPVPATGGAHAGDNFDGMQ